MFTLVEILEILITVFAVGFIFSGLIKKHQSLAGIFTGKILNWKNLKYSIIITAPAIILHEFAHKFTAMALGHRAIFHASYWGLGLGVLLRLANVGFVFFVPGYVSIAGASNSAHFGLIAFAGPLINLVLFSCSYLLLKYNKFPKYRGILQFTKKINIWLFALNMLPIPGFDGFKTYSSILSMI